MSKIKNAVSNLSGKAKAALAISTAFVVGSFQSASAAVPAIVGTTLTALEADAMSMIDLVWPFVLAVFGGLLLIKLFKRAGNKV